MKEPLVSIALPTRNVAEYLPECIESILQQTYTNWELIVVNDGSTDSTLAILSYYANKDKRIYLIHCNESQGIAKARNTALRHARGDYIAVMDSDDIMNRDRLKVALKELQKSDTDFFYSAYARANMKGEIQDALYTTKKITAAEIRFNLGVIPHVTIVAKHQCFIEHPFRDYLTSNDDLALTIDWYKAGYTYCSSRKPLVMVRYHERSTSATKDKEVKSFTKELLKELDGIQ